MMLRRFLRMRKALLGVAIVIVVVLTGVAAPLLAPADYTETDLGSVWAAPSPEHLLGADKLGRDILSRLMFGARVSLVVTVAVLSVTFTIGVSAGLVAGYFGGWIDAVVMRAADIVLAFPELIFAILVAAVLGAGIVSVIVALSLAWWPGVARLTRSLVLSLRSEAFLEAAVACGTPSGKILWRHVLPNIAPALIVRASIGVGFIVMAEATLSFLGIGVQEPTPSWGGMIRDGLEGLRTDPYLALFSSTALGVTILGFNLLGDGLRDLLDPRVGER
jgi:ABC-type dipeptide/oligopeptide/nickel transport system permease subunit